MSMEVKKSRLAIWKKPELIAITRSNPEEAVLTACKGDLSGSSSEDYSHCVSFMCGLNCTEIGAS